MDHVKARCCYGGWLRIGSKMPPVLRAIDNLIHIWVKKKLNLGFISMICLAFQVNCILESQISRAR